jgi:hypothetical protein
MTERRRDYKREYEQYHGRPDQIKKRALRVQARRDMEAKGLVKKGDGKDVDHKRALRDGGSNAISNLRVTSVKENRGWRRDED